MAKFFHDTYKKRDSPEILIDAALGRIELMDDTPRVAVEDPVVRITAAVHGGKGTIRQGIVRQLVVRFELGPGLHLYGEPVPEGMVATTVGVRAPDGIVLGEAQYPATRPLRVPSVEAELQIYDDRFDVVVPFYPDGRIASETRPLDREQARFEVEVRYQACDDEKCLLPKTERLSLEVPLDVIDVPKLGIHTGHGQREAAYDSTPHMRRMVLRSIRRRPLAFLRFVAKNIKLELAARKRRRR